MSQRNRIVLAALALAGLSLAPSHAAGLESWRIPTANVLERSWSWVARLLPVAHRTVGTQEKEGGMINPDGGTPSHFAAPTSPPAPSPGNGPR